MTAKFRSDSKRGAVEISKIQSEDIQFNLTESSAEINRKSASVKKSTIQAKTTLQEPDPSAQVLIDDDDEEGE